MSARSDTKKGAQERIQNCIAKMPRRANRKLFYFIDPYTLQEAGDDISKLVWLRSDGKSMSLPSFQVFAGRDEGGKVGNAVTSNWFVSPGGHH